MANSVEGVQIFVIDTFSADVVVATGQVWVNTIIMEGAGVADTATFIDNDTNEVLRLSNDIAGASKVLTFAKPQRFPNGLIFDDSASDLAANDFIFIYLSE